jgi:hypothetical protein
MVKKAIVLFLASLYLLGATEAYQLLKVPFSERFESPLPDMSTEKVTLKAFALENIPSEMIKRASSFFNISLILGCANID